MKAAPAEENNSKPDSPGYLPVIYPISPGIDGAKAMELAVGQEWNNIDFTLPGGRATSIWGTIAATDGAEP